MKGEGGAIPPLFFEQEYIMPIPEPPIDPPDDDPECPVCDAILHIATRELASCDACGWVNEPDWSDTGPVNP